MMEAREITLQGNQYFKPYRLINTLRGQIQAIHPWIIYRHLRGHMMYDIHSNHIPGHISMDHTSGEWLTSLP